MVLIPRSSVLVLLYVFLSVVVCPAAPGTLFIYTFMCWFYLMFCYVLVCHAPRTVFIYSCVCCFYYVVLCMWVFACCSLPCPWYRGPLHLLLAICYGSCGFIACFLPVVVCHVLGTVFLYTFFEPSGTAVIHTFMYLFFCLL